MTSLFKNKYFYHQHIKKFLIAIGEVFNDVTVRKHEQDGTYHQNIEIPVAYAPRNKWVSRKKEQPDLTAPQIEIPLPRITFQVVDVKYAGERKVGVPGAYVIGTIDGKRQKIFQPAPYDVTFKLYTYTKDQTDSLQILEQILPYFQPYLIINYEVYPEFQIKKDVLVNLNNYSETDSYDGSPGEHREVIQEYTFTAPLDFFGPGPTHGEAPVIKDVFINMGFMINAPHTQYEARVDPLTADKEDVYDIIEVVRPYTSPTNR